MRLDLPCFGCPTERLFGIPLRERPAPPAAVDPAGAIELRDVIVSGFALVGTDGSSKESIGAWAMAAGSELTPLGIALDAIYEVVRDCVGTPRVVLDSDESMLCIDCQFLCGACDGQKCTCFPALAAVAHCD